MPEIKRPVKPIEVNYVCDQCGHGMMKSVAAMDPDTGIVPHKCMICGVERDFKWVSYPKIDYIGVDETPH